MNFVEIDFQMSHAKFQDNRTFGSGEENFLRFYHIGFGEHLGHMTLAIYTESGFPTKGGPT